MKFPVAIAALILGLLAPIAPMTALQSASAAICPPFDQPQPPGCTPPTPPPGGPGPMQPGPMPAMGGSGFVSKFPKSRSIDRFSDASPQVQNSSSAPRDPSQIDYVGVGWDSSLRLQALPYIKAERNIGGGVREETLCANPTDAACQPRACGVAAGAGGPAGALARTHGR
ncbi:MAG: hypothetical protein EBX92_06370, partial [Actinobacteria bacterium]|nr:hypothetical protein [Actinomycetota bacterium]